MPKTAPEPLVEQLLRTWRINNAINLKLIVAIPPKGLLAVPLASRGRTVGSQLVHLHRVRVGWIKYNGWKVTGIPKFRKGAQPGKRELAAAFRASGKAVEAYLRERLTSNRRIGFFRGQPVRWLAYMIAHESHHRGSIMLALKQNGLRMTDKVALTQVWYSWYAGDY